MISGALGLVVLVVSYLSSQECGRLNRDLSTPHHSLTYLSTSICWLLTSTIISILSTLLLCSLLYLDSFRLTRPTWLILPVLVLGLAPFLQSIIYHLMIKEGCEHKFAWGIFAAVTPVRFLETERRKSARFLTINQVSWLSSHSAAWLVYCVFSLLTDQADTVFRVWLPLIMPLLLIPPLTACLHWAISLSPLYTSRYAHPDMSREEKRSASFPPDWAQLAGTSLPPESLARAGFFYSCRRLTSSETTCFSSGRQVTDWSNIKEAELARMASEDSPLAIESKQAPSTANNMDNNNVSCFAEFLFIASTLLFRIASICLLLWVFMVRKSLPQPSELCSYISGPVEVSWPLSRYTRHNSSSLPFRIGPVQHDHLLHLPGQQLLQQPGVGGGLVDSAKTCQVFTQLCKSSTCPQYLLQPPAPRFPVGRSHWGLLQLLSVGVRVKTSRRLAGPASAGPPLGPPHLPLLLPHSEAAASPGSAEDRPG